ncbi:DUF1508 domain-containing protein [Streptomyces agglomeratus]|uniref:DUF1508 domain-containing protein n=1 Tax=Streptomyces agglomeratus TaxID=285458 RepID=UPI0009A03692
MAARFEVRHQPAKGYHFVLIATNRQVIATSEHYEPTAPAWAVSTRSNATPTPPSTTSPPTPAREANIPGRGRRQSRLGACTTVPRLSMERQVGLRARPWTPRRVRAPRPRSQSGNWSSRPRSRSPS